MFRWIVRGVGVLLVVVGLVSIYQFVHQVGQESSVDQAQQRAWRDLVGAAAGPVETGTPGPDPSPSAPSACTDCYLRLVVPKLAREMVAIDSDWTGLKRAPMVHYRGSPAPGEKGNMLIAFHREFKWPDIDKLKAGDQVQVETPGRQSFTYQVDFVRIVKPSDISLLQPTQGSDLTLITCDPWLQDYNRMLFRAHLVAPVPSVTPSPGG
jgi:sortase A